MSEPILKAHDLRRRFGEVEALAGLSLEVDAGEIYGLVGPDGAGKTTAIRIMTGVIGAGAGQVEVGGHDPLRSTEVRDMLGYMPQQYSLYGDLTVAENLSFFAAMFSLPKPVFLERRQRLLGITRLAPFVDRRADALSGGMYKKLALACALLHRPRLLVLDEPTNGVDPVSRREFWDLLRDFAQEGMAVVLSTPYMDEAARCHRVGLVHQGRLLDEGEPAKLLAGFPHRAFRVEGGERDAVSSALDAHPQVFALSPAGARIRVVVERGAERQVAAALAPLGSQLVPTAPDFEDLFLSRLREETARSAEAPP
ncbi:MAG: ABC transporter ATP-binding protein [Deltaproteobacteria bacterium]|jgi:ABC-2 type transport system ATP-binding protein|nr:ABC transporter ATP-binding protein [Deltaproteobacteria bacterium]MBW2531216.1 ABC transporter ATP-binding protein [Deltaproteobacteria bacterium]